MSDPQPTVTANGQSIEVQLPLSLHDFLEGQGMLPRSVVVELNGEAVSPSNSTIANSTEATRWRL